MKTLLTLALVAFSAVADVNEDTLGYATAMVQRNEGYSEHAYWDAQGHKWTIGWGSTRYKGGGVPETLTLGTAEAKAAVHEYLLELMVLAEKRVPGWGSMDPRLRAAMLDTAYNVGRQYFTRSPRMIRRLAAGEDPAVVIADENRTWVKAGGVKVKGLVIRRQRVKTLLIDWYVRDRDKKKPPALRPG